MAQKKKQATNEHVEKDPIKSKSTKSKKSKKAVLIDLLSRTKGATLDELGKASGWQAHSVRGFLSGTIRKLPESELIVEAQTGKPRRYLLRKAA